MTVDMKFRAVVQLHAGTDHNDLKRLALFFDEIYFVMPTIFTLNGEYLEKQGQSRFHRVNNDISVDLDDFVFSRDVEAGHLTTNLGWRSQLTETLSAFKDHGIAKELTDELPGLPVEDHFLAIRSNLASFDINDKTFNGLSGTISEDYSFDKLVLQSMTFQPLGEPELSPILFAMIVKNVPKSILASYEVTTTLYASHETSAFPVFLHPMLKKVMEYRYEQYKKGLEVLKEFTDDIVSAADFKASFGEITFNIANALLSSDIVATKTPGQIIKYRNAMANARQHFLSENLLEIASIVQDNPWNSRTKEEIEKYIMGKLNQAILRYNEASQQTWEKLYGNIAVHLAQIVKSTTIGSSAGIVGSLIPNTSAWHMLLIGGALVGAAKEAPNLVRSIVDTILEDSKGRRSSIAYIARFK